MKARAKADRAAARQAASAPLVAAMLIAPSVILPIIDHEGSPGPGTNDGQSQEVEDADLSTTTGSKEISPDRNELLRSKPAVVGRFMRVLVPILIDVYAASVITPVRVKTLTGLLKAVSFLDADGLKRVLAVSLK